VREYWHAAWDANDRKQFDEAEKLFLLALEEAEKFPSNLEEREMSYAGLGEFYRQRGDYVKAEPFLRKVLVLNETEFGESSPHLISGFAYLAGFYDEWGRTVEAERLYQRALAIGEETLDRAADEALKKYGAFLDRNNRSPEAREIDAKIEDIKVRRVKKGTTPEANAERAVGMLRTIVTSAVTYQTVYGNGYPASLAVLAPPMDGSVNYSCDAAGLIDDLLAAGEQWGYRIAYNGGELVEQRYEGCTVVGVLSFWVSARPLEYGVTGWHSFFVDDSGVIRRTSEDREATEDDPALEDGDPK
jgi:tetratricopeptide (TPR) repeat protein